MKKLLSFGLLLASAIGMNAQQVQGDFNETWVQNKPWDSKNTSGKDCGTDYITPVGWTVSNVSGMSGNGKTQVATKVTGITGETNDFAVHLENKANSYMPSQLIPAYITLGTSWATAKVSMWGSLSISNADGGAFGSKAFSNRPDAISFNYKRSHGTVNTSENASVVAFLWKGSSSQESVPGNVVLGKTTTVTMIDRDRNILGLSTSEGGAVTYSDDFKRIATINTSIEGDATEWTKYTAEFNYEDNEAVPEKINIIISANDYFGDRSTIGTGNTLTLDDVELIYYHELTALTYGDTEILTNPEAGKTYYCDEVFNESSTLTATLKGVGATWIKSYDPNTAILTVTVFGDDYNASSNPTSKSEYYVQFTKVETYSNSILVNAKNFGGKQFYEQKNIDILTHKTSESSTTTDLKLADFYFGEISVGDILVENVTVGSADGWTTYSCEEGTMVELHGDMEGGSLPMTLNAKSKGSDMLATIDIILGETVINVVFAPAVTMDGSAAITATGLNNVKVARSFKQGWNTLALPFAITTDELGTGVKAQEFSGVTADGSGLNFTAVTSLEANKPYLVYFPAATDVAEYFGTNISAVDETGVTHGAYTFKPNFSNPSLSMAGNYGVVTADGVSKIMKGGAGSTLQTIRAYFTGKGAETARIYFDGETTGIDNITNAPANGKIYNLQGVEVSGKLPAGVYVKNGEKVIIK